MNRAITDINKHTDSAIVQVLFGTRQPDPHCQPVRFEAFNKGLNAPQLEAISFALGRTDVGLIHGPPGKEY